MTDQKLKEAAKHWCIGFGCEVCAAFEAGATHIRQTEVRELHNEVARLIEFQPDCSTNVFPKGSRAEQMQAVAMDVVQKCRKALASAGEKEGK